MDHTHHDHHKQDQQSFSCPMHPEVIKPAPGKCPKCGMDLVQVEKKVNKQQPAHKHHHQQQQGYDKHAGHHTENFLKRFWVCLVLTVPVMTLSHMIQQWFGFELSFAGDKYVLLILGSVIYFYGGMPFFKGMISEIKFNNIGMMTLVALAISVAFIYSAAVVFGLAGMDFFWELATLIDIMLLGHWLEMRSQMAASNALQSLVALLPSIVHVERNGTVTDIDIKELKNDEVVIIKPGEKIPADGWVLEGHSFVNESMLTGESKPVKKGKDEKLIAGAVNGDGSLKIKVTATGADSYLNKVITLVQSAQAAKSNSQNLADRVAKWLTFISIGVGAMTFIIWYVNHDLSFALERMVTVMVTACPHALGVAIPLVVAISTTISATHGLLIRNRTAFENARNITTIVFDKTGTLTKGSHEVQKILSISQHYKSEELLQYAAAVQQHSEHYIAKGILHEIKKKDLSLLPSTGFQYDQGMGVSAIVQGKKVVAAGPNYFFRENKPLPEIPSEIDQDSETIIFILINNEPAGFITLADTIRETASSAIARLKQMNIKVYLLTGDNEKIAASVSNKLSMDGYFANILPHQKQEKIKEFQEKGEVVAMTGDGVNDAPSLAQADIGIAVGSGTDVAAETADIILVNSDPEDVAVMISFGRSTYRKMKQNLAWAIGYNVAAIPLAAGVLYPYFMLSPAMGAVLMSLSTIIVAINARSLRLK
ncbi:MAG TPA: heavy metal translocating P-type ATPase [Chitinophagaceae bacterium]|nr:heavy metal translocating P-type ATPase [Chitinophagaceae bacterium]